MHAFIETHTQTLFIIEESDACGMKMSTRTRREKCLDLLFRTFSAMRPVLISTVASRIIELAKYAEGIFFFAFCRFPECTPLLAITGLTLGVAAYGAWFFFVYDYHPEYSAKRR